MTMISPSQANRKQQIQEASAVNVNPTCKRKIVEIIAIAALALIAAAIAAIVGFVLSGVVACVIAAGATTILITVGAIAHQALEPKKVPHKPSKSIQPSIVSIPATIPPIVPTPQWTVAMLKERVSNNQPILSERLRIENKQVSPPPRQSLQWTSSNPCATGSYEPVPAATVMAQSKILPLEALPKLCDIDKYTPPFSLDFPIQSFSNCEMAGKMQELTLLMKKHRPYNLKHSITTLEYLSSKLVAFVGSHSELYGWKRYAAATLYSTNWKEIFQGKIAPPLEPDEFTNIQALETKGKNLCLKLVQRLEWIVEIFRKEETSFDPTLCLESLGTDIDFLNEINLFSESCEKAIGDLLSKDPKKFSQYRATQYEELKKKDDWPHSVQLFTDIEKTGFKFKPMMVKRDRCVCDICYVEVSGWHAWMDPQKLHNTSKH